MLQGYAPFRSWGRLPSRGFTCDLKVPCAVLLGGHVQQIEEAIFRSNERHALTD